MKKLLITLFFLFQVAIFSSDLKITTIDVGQADSHLIISPSGKTLLIDTGNKGDYDEIDAILQENKIKKLDYLITTHPDEDHIGGAAKIIEKYKPSSIFMPNKKKTTLAFKNMLLAIKNINGKVTIPKVLDKIELEKDVVLTIYAPDTEKYEGTNNYSIVGRLVYKDFSMLFTGDAETESIDKMLQGKYNLKSNVLKSGHHGSKNANNMDLLKAVKPTEVIISVGADNKYGHPNSEVLDMFKKQGIKIYRTDLNGNIIITSDGKKYKIVTEK